MLPPLRELKLGLMDRLAARKDQSCLFSETCNFQFRPLPRAPSVCLLSFNVDICILEGAGLVEFSECRSANRFVVSAPGLICSDVSTDLSDQVVANQQQLSPDSVEVTYFCSSGVRSFYLTVSVHDQVIYSAWVNRPMRVRFGNDHKLCVGYSIWVRLVNWEVCSSFLIIRMLTVIGDNSTLVTVASCLGKNFYSGLLQAAERHAENVRIQELVFKLLCYCCYWCPSSIVLDCNIVEFVCRVMRSHAACKYIQERGCWCFQHIALSSEENKLMLQRDEDVTDVCWKARTETSWCALQTIAVINS